MSLKKKWAILLACLSLFAFTACAPQAAPLPGATQAAGTGAPSGAQPPADAATQPGTSPDGLANTRWTLISQGTPGSETPVITGSAPTLEFGASGQAVGNGGCNTFGAIYTVKGSGITFGTINSTMKACADNSLMQQEQQYFQGLQKANTFTRNGDRMLIFYNGSQGVMNFVQAKDQT